MLGLVASSNLFMIFIFWELVGICSYLLIGFWYEEKVNCDAANKAFVVNRIGDVGMLVGLGLLWTSLGTFNFHEISQGLHAPGGEFNTTSRTLAVSRWSSFAPTEAGPSMASRSRCRYWLLTVAGLGVFAGCVGKSAQFPLHVWLPDAMAGPTPVSALIHAATMVAAGVYLVGRFFPVFTPFALLWIAYTGGITLMIAATIAVVQTDYKKVLAYSTVSQLGFMMLALGVGGRAAGLFHLLTHAFFKALLFLGAGSVYHSVHTYEMPALGGLQKKMPITALTMLVGTLAISGVPFFSGFYSKDAILAAAIARVWQSPEHFLLFLLAGPRGDDHRLLHVSHVVPDLRRRGPGLPDRGCCPVGSCRGRGARAGRSRSRAWPRPEPSRPEPGRPRPRERAGHDLAPHHPRGLQRLRGLDLVDWPADSAPPCWSR